MSSSDFSCQAGCGRGHLSAALPARRPIAFGDPKSFFGINMRDEGRAERESYEAVAHPDSIDARDCRGYLPWRRQCCIEPGCDTGFSQPGKSGSLLGLVGSGLELVSVHIPCLRPVGKRPDMVAALASFGPDGRSFPGHSAFVRKNRPRL